MKYSERLEVMRKRHRAERLALVFECLRDAFMKHDEVTKVAGELGVTRNGVYGLMDEVKFKR